MSMTATQSPLDSNDLFGGASGITSRITIRDVAGDPFEVEAENFGLLAVHKMQLQPEGEDDECYTLSHLPTGYAVAHCATRDDAMLIKDALIDARANFDFDDKADKKCARLKKIFDGLEQVKPAMTTLSGQLIYEVR